MDSGHTLGAAVIVAIIGETKVLLIQETSKPLPHFWKLISETVEPHETVLDAILRGCKMEAGLDLTVDKLHGCAVKITDPRVLSSRELTEPDIVGKVPHWRHFWGIRVDDKTIDSLSKKHLEGDGEEQINTLAFPLSEFGSMVDLLPQHRKLLEKLREPAAA